MKAIARILESSAAKVKVVCKEHVLLNELFFLFPSGIGWNEVYQVDCMFYSDEPEVSEAWFEITSTRVQGAVYVCWLGL